MGHTQEKWTFLTWQPGSTPPSPSAKINESPSRIPWLSFHYYLSYWQYRSLFSTRAQIRTDIWWTWTDRKGSNYNWDKDIKFECNLTNIQQNKMSTNIHLCQKQSLNGIHSYVVTCEDNKQVKTICCSQIDRSVNDESCKTPQLLHV